VPNNPPTPLDKFFQILVSNAGAALPQRPQVDLSGAGVVVTDDAVNNITKITIAGASNYAPTLDGASSSVSDGDSVVSAGNFGNANVTRAAATSMAAAPGPIGVVTAPASPGGTPTVQTNGAIPKSVSGLGAGATQRVKINPSTGRISRVPLPDGSEAIIGAADAQGNVVIAPNQHIGTTPIHVINVKAAPYGAAGDGATDDTAAIQAAYNVLSGRSALASGIIYFPQGTYLASSTLTFTGNPNISIKFMGNKAGGAGSQILWTGANQGIMMHTYGLFLSTFDNLIFNGNPAGSISGTTACAGLWCDTDQLGGGSGSESNTFSHCTFVGFKGTNAGVGSSGVWLGQTAGSYDVFGFTFDHCFFTGDASSPSQYMYACVQNIAGGVGNTEDFFFRHCTFQFAEYGYYGGHTNNNLSFTDGCVWEGISTAGVYITDGQLYINGAVVEIANATKQGLFVSSNGTVSTVVIQSSEIVVDATNNSPQGVVVSASGSLTMRGCYVDGTGGLQAGSTATIAAVQTGNCIAGGTSSVNIEDCIWFAEGSGSYGPPQQIPVYNGGNLVTGTPADRGTSQISGELHRYQIKLKNNRCYNSGLGVSQFQDFVGIPPQNWITGLVDNGSNAPYYMAQNVYRGLPTQGTTEYVIKSTDPVFKQNSQTVAVWLGSVLRGTAIVRVIADTTTPWAGTGTTIKVEVGSDIAPSEDLIAQDVKTAAVTYGLVAGDLGSALSSPVQGANLGSWGGGRGLLATFLMTGAGQTFGTGTGTNMTQGETHFFVTTDYVGYP
jgi:hypothetical protein